MQMMKSLWRLNLDRIAAKWRNLRHIFKSRTVVVVVIYRINLIAVLPYNYQEYPKEIRRPEKTKMEII